MKKLTWNCHGDGFFDTKHSRGKIKKGDKTARQREGENEQNAVRRFQEFHKEEETGAFLDVPEKSGANVEEVYRQLIRKYNLSPEMLVQKLIKAKWRISLRNSFVRQGIWEASGGADGDKSGESTQNDCVKRTVPMTSRD